MAFTLYEAAKISRNPLTRGVFLGIAVTNELFASMPFVPKSGSAWTYPREKALPTIEFVDPANPTTTESSATFDDVTVPLRLIETDVDVLNTTLNQNDPNGDPRALQLKQKLKALGLKLCDRMFGGGYVTSAVFDRPGSSPAAALVFVSASAHTDSTRFGPGDIKYVNTGTFWSYRAPGDRTFGTPVAVASNTTGVVLSSDNPNKKIVLNITVASATADGVTQVNFASTTQEFDGLPKLVPSSQTVASTAAGVDGDALSFDVMDQLIYEKLKIRSQLAFFMNAKLKRKFMALARSASGGMMPEQLAIPVLGMNGQPSNIYVPQYNGIPIFQVDDIPSNEAKGSSTTLSSIYLASLEAEQGLYFGVQQASEAALASLTPYDVVIGGVKMYDIGQLEAKAAFRTRVEWYGSLALGSEYAAARASEIKTL
jgi:hypothetical protein